MENTLEYLLSVLPKSITFSNQGQKNEAGLSLRYSTSRKVWVFGYGSRRVSPKYYGFGATPLEAIEHKLMMDK